jgi:hypothetical protein
MRQIALITLLAVAGMSCLNPFSPASISPSDIKPIVKQTSPDSVLHNFKYAYEHNDVDVYENCLDPNFIFRYTDQNLAGEIEMVEIPRDGPSGDVTRTRLLFTFFDEIKLETWVPFFDRYEKVGSETWQVYKAYFQLSVRDIDNDFGGQSLEAVGIAEFKFRKSTKDSLWRIVYWDDKSAM